MTEEQFEKNYPKDKYKYVRTSFKKKGSQNETEIEHFDIILLETDETVLKASRTEHTNLRDLVTTVNWEW